MENQEIQSKVQKLKTVDDLASLLTAIKKDEFSNVKAPVTRKRSCISHTARMYPTGFIPSIFERRAVGSVKSMLPHDNLVSYFGC